jgi:N-acetyl-anhydromuramyl-L-alanine amidase AmpD
MNTPNKYIGGETFRLPMFLKLFVLLLLAALGIPTATASTDYGPAIWRPVYSGHWYTSGHGHKFVVIHDIEGYYLSTISYFQRSSTQASVHFYVNGKKDSSSDANAGEVSQGVRTAYYAWHVRCWNTYSAGTEHEGFASNPAWYTDAMYNATGALQRHLCNLYGLPKDRNHVIGHDQKRISGWPAYASSHFGIDPYCNDHTDPGPYWNWTKLMNIINNVAATPSGPSTLTVAVVSASQLNLTWKDNSGIETGFKVERATAAAGPFTQIGTTVANDVTFSATGLASGTRYYFRVRAYNAAGNSPYSNVANNTTKDTIPGAPSALVATAISQDQINLTWTQGAGNEDGFRIG